MTLNESLRAFYHDPFSFFDRIHIIVKGNELNIFQKYQRLQKTTLYIALFCLAGWIVCGFDSTPLQLIYAGLAALGRVVPFFLSFTGVNPSLSASEVYNYYYGKDMHWSAIVIYFAMYYAISKHFSNKFNIIKSKNVAYSASITFLSIAMFEYFWIYSFAFWQNQWWVGTWAMPQLKILIQNFGFASVGVIGVLYLWIDSYILDKDSNIVGRNYKLNLMSVASLGLIFITVLLIAIWWFYPWPVQQIVVPLQNGQSWVSSSHFPQTLYTIKTNPASSVNAGEWFWHEDNWVHGLNTLLKVVWAAAVASVFWIQKVEKT